jgi:type II secretory pathway component PulK
MAVPQRRARRRQSGVILMVVLFFSLLLTASIASFQRQAVMDAMIVRNREDAAQAEALARGGIRIAQAVLIQDRLAEEAGEVPIDGREDSWAQLAATPIEAGGGTLQLEIRDSGGRLNLNALFGANAEGSLVPQEQTEAFLIEMLEKLIGELPVDPGAKALYEPRELAANLIDWIDSDEDRMRGGPENAYYEDQDPSYQAANHPLLSVEDLRWIEGFDDALVRRLKPYVTVYPFAPGSCSAGSRGCGVNLNTAPPHVLALLYFNDGVDSRLADEDTVRRIIEARQGEGGICAPASRQEGCTPISEIVVNPIFPPPTYSSEVFVVVATAQVGEIRRSVEAVVDRSEPSDPRLLSWHVR